MEEASWIRRMFEEGANLKRKYGEENVYDFSIGNPCLEPPERFFESLKEVVCEEAGGKHRYMSNAGYQETRNAVAEYLSKEHGVQITGDLVVMTCGAGGGLNILFKTLLDPGDEVVVPAPYFVEYGFYADNSGGVLKPVRTAADFSLDLAAIDEAISENTKIVLINSPNNPTGRVYDGAAITALGDLLEGKSREFGQEIYLVSDEPYSKIVYDGIAVPSVFQAYTNSVLVTSYSKDLSIAGERLGFVALNPKLAPLDETANGLVFANRILGFVNAPSLIQRVVTHLQGVASDMDAYRAKRDLICNMLAGMGYEFTRPEGAFYLFPKAPIEDVRFVKELQEEHILVVPGSGFGGPGYFRISYSVADSVIKGSEKGFARLAEKYF
jgi:aspartate aminotransferase